MGERFYLEQAKYIKAYNKSLRDAGTKAEVIEKILVLNPELTEATLKKQLKEPLVEILNELEKDINMATWTDELKEEVIKAYQDANPTPETSAEILKQIAEDYEVTANGVRMVLVKANVYVKKEEAATASKVSASGEGAKRVSKESQLNALKSALKTAGVSVDDELIDKMTGKMATYFAEAVKQLTKS